MKTQNHFSIASLASRLSLATRLYSIFALFALLTAAITALSDYNTRRATELTESIEIADPKPAVQKVVLPNDEFPLIKVEYFPVVRQTYILKSGIALVLDAFKFPKVPIPMNDLTGILNNAAFRPGDKFWKPRFGPFRKRGVPNAALTMSPRPDEPSTGRFVRLCT